MPENIAHALTLLEAFKPDMEGVKAQVATALKSIPVGTQRWYALVGARTEIESERPNRVLVRMYLRIAGSVE